MTVTAEATMAVDSLRAPVGPGTKVGPARSGGAGRRFLRDPGAVAGAVLVLVIAGAVLLAPWIAPHDPNLQDKANVLASPSASHVFGTDMLGRDMLSRLLHGGRTSVLLAVMATAGIGVLGLLIGVVSGLVGGIVDTIIGRIIEVIEVLPMLLVAMLSIRILGPGPDKLVLVFVAVGWPGYARVVRASTLSLRERAFVDASRASGAGWIRVMGRHIVPNLMGPVTVLSTIGLGRILLGLTALSFLGFGVQPPHPEWGRMMADAKDYFYAAPRMLIYPGAAISLLVLAVNLCGDGLRDALDTKVDK